MDEKLMNELERVAGEAHELADAIGLQSAQQVLTLEQAMKLNFLEGCDFANGRTTK